jgi:hypothetical protein
MFATVDLLGKKSMSMSTIDKTDLITKSIFDTLIPISVLVYEKDIHVSHKGQDAATNREKGQGVTRTRAGNVPCPVKTG